MTGVCVLIAVVFAYLALGGTNVRIEYAPTSGSPTVSASLYAPS